MAKTFRPFPHAIQAIKMACVFLLAIPTSIASDTIDQAMLKGDIDLKAFNTFYVNENYSINLKFDLDILLTPKQYKAAINGNRKRSIIDEPNIRWPDATIYYEIDGSVRHGTSAIKEALDHREMFTGMKFVESQNPWRIKFKSGQGCASHVGNRRNIQDIVLADWCLKKPTIVHEVGHAVGFFHEQNRADRDQYVKVYDSSLMFAIILTGQTSFGVPYDYLSVMHYGSNGGMIITIDPAYQNRIGKSPGLSFKDIKQTHRMYNCSKLRSNCADKSCPFNGFVFFKAFQGLPACECFCDSGDQYDPLVPCSSITHEVPGPNPVAASSKETIDPNPCFDLRPDCDSLKTKGLCKSELILMHKQCTKTCGFCGKNKDLCMDSDPSCAVMAASCTDANLKELMNMLCRKTCRLCTESAMCDIQKALNG